jgi:hypothetical integral membrane protein (TIGR02206 family)
MMILGPQHIRVLVFVLAFTVFASLLYKKSNPSGRRAWRISMALALVAIEVFKQISSTLAYGEYKLEYLPLHLCGVSIIVIAWHTIRQTTFTSEYLFALSIPGAVMALLFSDWSLHPLSIVRSMTTHMLEIAYPAMLLFTGEIRPSIKRVWIPLVFLSCLTIIDYRINVAFGTNFLFIGQTSIGSPLGFLADVFGTPEYLFVTAGLFVVMWCLMYGILSIVQGRRENSPALQKKRHSQK